MNTKNLLVGGVAGTVFIFAFEFLVHGVLLANSYAATSDLWRPMAEMESMMWFSILIQVATALAMAYYMEKKHIHGWKAGACFGAMIGAFYAISAVGQYAYLPIAFSLPFIWAVAMYVKMIGVGAVIGYFSKH